MARVKENPALSALRKRIAKVPSEPGVYRWLGADGDVLYVGKAKHLRDRLKSYVQPGAKHSPWKTIMMRIVEDFDITVVNSELEAYVLETNLIKQFKPKYNIMMKDDKNYVYVRITMQETFPRVDVVRRIDDDGALYFGPKTSADLVRKNLSFLRTLFPFRTCKMNIDVDVPHRGDAATSAQIPLTIVCTHRDRPTPCLDFHMKQCSAPCIGNVTPEDYRRNSIDGVVAFFEGKYKEVAETLKAAMREAAAAKKFEKAAMLRDHFTRMTELQEKQMMSDTSGENTDYIGVALRDNRASVVVLRERDGKVLDEQSFDLTGDADTTADVLGQFLPQYYDNVTEYPDCVVAAEAPDENHLFADWISSRKGSRVELRIPERGKKSSLLVLAEKNADLKVAQRITKWEVRAGGTDQALKDLAETLRLVSVPKRIEGYDISHLGGSFTVGSMVVLQNGVPKRDHYRSFSVRGLDGAIDDYASLKDVLTRRLKYLGVSIKEEEKLWKERGVTVGKAKKNDLHCIEETMKEEGTFELNDLAMKDFIVARHEETIVGFVRLFSHAEKLTELKSLWVHPNFRGQRLGRFLARKILQSRKKGKVYVTVDASLESYYADIGFRHVLHEPELFQKRLDAYHALCPPRGVTMMIEVAKQNIDPSFSVRPDLILIDGGKGQLGVAMDVLRDLHLAIPVASLAKREEEIFVPDSSDPVALPKNAPAQFLLQRLRDEAHRFANVIREKQGKNAMLQSGFDAVDGIGPKTRALLLKKFGSMDAAKQASDDELKRLLNTSQLKAFRKKLG